MTNTGMFNNHILTIYPYTDMFVFFFTNNETWLNMECVKWVADYIANFSSWIYIIQKVQVLHQLPRL